MNKDEITQLETLTILVTQVANDFDGSYLSIGELLRYEGMITSMIDAFGLMQTKLRHHLDVSTN